MLNNAQWIADKQVFAATHQGADRGSIKFPNEKDRWYPPTSSEAFVKIATHLSTPTDVQLIAAIHGQFDCVLQRDATPEELDKYLLLFRAAIKLAGNKDGLRQMLVSVLLQSEFLYRQEFGAGEQDAHGRQKLSPREASYAIAYAVSDRVPDEELVKAVSAGRLDRKDFVAEYRENHAGQQGPANQNKRQGQSGSTELSRPTHAVTLFTWSRNRSSARRPAS